MSLKFGTNFDLVRLRAYIDARAKILNMPPVYWFYVTWERRRHHWYDGDTEPEFIAQTYELGRKYVYELDIVPRIAAASWEIEKYLTDSYLHKLETNKKPRPAGKLKRPYVMDLWA